MEQIFHRYSDAEYERRIGVVRTEMAARGLDALIVVGDAGSKGANHANIYWLTNWVDPYPAYVILTPSAGPFLLMSNQLYLHTAQRAGRAVTIEAFSYAKGQGETLAEKLLDLGLANATIGIAGVRNVGRSSMSAEHKEALGKAMPGARFEDAIALMAQARAIKSAEEIADFETGAALTDRTIEHLCARAHVGMPEHQLARIITEAVLPDNGAMRVLYVGSTPMDAPELIFPWQYPSNRTIRQGDVIVTELSAAYHYCAGQIHRPFSVGGAPTDRYRRLYDLAAEAYTRVFETLKPGATDVDVRAAARGIEAAGYKTFDVLLHGWGLQIEDPRVDLPCAIIKRPQPPVLFKEGMLIVIQPHVVTPDGKAGLQVGNLVLIEKNGARALQQFPLGFLRID